MTTQRRRSSRPAGKVLPPEVTLQRHPRSTEAGGRGAEWASAAAAQGRTSVLGPRHVLHLQRQHGNQAVTGLITSPSAVVQRSALEKSASEAERNKVQVLTTQSVRSIGAEKIDEAFSAGVKTNWALDSVIYGDGIADKIKPGLLTLAGDMFDPKSFGMNMVTNVPLNLKKYGGVNGVYRFALIQRNAKPKTQLIVDQVSSAPPAKLDKSGMKKQEARFQKFGFRFGTDFGSEDAKNQLFTALARVPDSILERIRGVKFSRKMAATGKGGEAGHYDPETHTIEMFGNSMQDFTSSVDSAGSSGFAAALTHEISHAVDFEAFTAARLKQEAAANELKDFEKSLRTVDLTGGLPDDRQKAAKDRAEHDQRKKLQDQLNKATAELAKVSPGGSAYTTSQRSQGSGFQQAQGNAISKYGKTNKIENFAESLSIFILDPDQLKILRPKLFEYFTKNFS